MPVCVLGFLAGLNERYPVDFAGVTRVMKLAGRGGAITQECATAFGAGAAASVKPSPEQGRQHHREWNAEGDEHRVHRAIEQESTNRHANHGCCYAESASDDERSMMRRMRASFHRGGYGLLSMILKRTLFENHSLPSSQNVVLKYQLSA